MSAPHCVKHSPKNACEECSSGSDYCGGPQYCQTKPDPDCEHSPPGPAPTPPGPPPVTPAPSPVAARLNEEFERDLSEWTSIGDGIIFHAWDKTEMLPMPWVQTTGDQHHPSEFASAGWLNKILLENGRERIFTEGDPDIGGVIYKRAIGDSLLIATNKDLGTDKWTSQDGKGCKKAVEQSATDCKDLHINDKISDWCCTLADSKTRMAVLADQYRRSCAQGSCNYPEILVDTSGWTSHCSQLVANIQTQQPSSPPCRLPRGQAVPQGSRPYLVTGSGPESGTPVDAFVYVKQEDPSQYTIEAKSTLKNHKTGRQFTAEAWFNYRMLYGDLNESVPLLEFDRTGSFTTVCNSLADLIEGTPCGNAFGDALPLAKKRWAGTDNATGGNLFVSNFGTNSCDYEKIAEPDHYNYTVCLSCSTKPTDPSGPTSQDPGSAQIPYCACARGGLVKGEGAHTAPWIISADGTGRCVT